MKPNKILKCAVAVAALVLCVFIVRDISDDIHSTEVYQHACSPVENTTEMKRHVLDHGVVTGKNSAVVQAILLKQLGIDYGLRYMANNYLYSVKEDVVRVWPIHGGAICYDLSTDLDYDQKYIDGTGATFLRAVGPYYQLEWRQ